MAANSGMQLFSSSGDFADFDFGFGFGFAGDCPQEAAFHPPPPSVEVLPSEVSQNVKYTVEPVNLGELTLLKGRVSTHEVFSLSNSDLVPGKYEGGLKLWEGSMDLVNALQSEIQAGHLSFSGKRVLELGCGHGLPAIFACLEGAPTVHLQDFNAEVLQCLTIPNMDANLKKSQAPECRIADRDIRFFGGDWSNVHQILPYVIDNEEDAIGDNGSASGGYDVILMAETVYSVSSLQNLYELVKKCMGCPHGVTYMAGKKHYFGVGGGTRRFLSLVEKDGIMTSSIVAEVADGSSNLREIWRLSFK
ncbi:histidine protein methyltransferase 1 homolog [Rhodamnia argentea]|uniref:protein-histidine N-methyltransferase n=1 Tax=Rhodamnia argentea TaxID=178133 RepID=A0A8B8PIA6_9MYRT|nr:histidine protein methyltransferase 1 homolog [Rhodamnia argentea]